RAARAGRRARGHAGGRVPGADRRARPVRRRRGGEGAGVTVQPLAAPLAIARSVAPPGSTLWLLGFELKMAWRKAISGRRGRARLIVIGVAALAMVGLGLPVAMGTRGIEVPVNSYSILIADAGTLLVFTLMLSQALAGGIEALYTRGDLDLLFSSPL